MNLLLSETQQLLRNYRSELESELTSIISYWTNHTVDSVNGGFVGRINNNNTIDVTAPKGVVLNCRILWTFSAAYRANRNDALLNLCNRSFEYLKEKFRDLDYGGVYWMVNAEGNPLDTKKQIYAQAFAVYALSEYFMASGSPEAKEWAIDLFELMEAKSYDVDKKGYIDALSGNWKELNDVRLSDKDANEKKTMNTHLHVLEGYVNLYKIWPDKILQDRIKEILGLFLSTMIDKTSGHLRLFFDEDWNSKSDLVSFGHDIEAAWLLLDAARIIMDKPLIAQLEKLSIQVAQTTLNEGVDKDGGLWYEYEPAKKYLIKEKHWWPQAEAMLGFFNAWELTGDQKFLEYSLNSWKFTREHIIDKINGEWFWGIKEDYSIMEGEDKVGIWKCPYHNGRACMELISRIDHLLQS